MTQPYFSILIPVYNSAEYLPACLDSIFQQKNAPEFEVIAVDDGSEDQVSSILAGYANMHDNLRIIRHSSNLGTYQSRFDAIASAIGSYLIFVDSDDIIMPDFLASAYVTTCKGKYDIVQFHFTASAAAIRKNKKAAALYFPDGYVQKKSELMNAFFKGKIRSALWGKVFAAHLFQNIPVYSLPNCYGEDWFLTLQLLLRAQCYLYKKEPVYYYNYGAGINGQPKYTLKQFEQFCRRRLTFVLAKRILSRKKYSAEILDLLQQEEYWFLNYFLLPMLRNQVGKEFQLQGFQILLRYWKRLVWNHTEKSVIIDKWTPLITFILLSKNFFKIFFHRWLLRLTGKSLFSDETERKGKK